MVLSKNKNTGTSIYFSLNLNTTDKQSGSLQIVVQTCIERDRAASTVELHWIVLGYIFIPSHKLQSTPIHPAPSIYCDPK
jgi:hypothetical protein